MVKLRANLIKQTNANKVAEDFTSYCKSKSDCLYKNKKRKYHGWLNLTNLSQNNKVAQCGWDDGDCNHNTHYGIGGYHNVCPIAGLNGDYVWPAKLQFLNFSFEKNGITSTAKIKSIKVSFEHRMVAIDTGTGRIYDNFGPNFHAKNDYAVKIYFTKGSSVISEVKKSNSNPKLSKTKFDQVNYTFNNFSISDILNNNFALNIEYNHNYNTNPGIIYIKNVVIDVDYEDAKIFIEGSSDNNNLYTNTDTECCTEAIHTISAGYRNGNGVISPSNAPSILSSEIKCIEKPDGVTVKQLHLTNSNKQFKITDNSGIAGEKIIKYALSNHPDQQCILKYNAIIKPKPQYHFITTYKANEDFDSSKNYVVFNKGCASSIFIYIDSIANNPIELPVADKNNEINILDESAKRIFHDNIKTLSCGYHTLYIQRGNESFKEIQKNKVLILIKPMEYKFHVYTNENHQGELRFIQSKNNQTRYSEILLERIDDEPQEDIPTLYIFDETQPSLKTEVNNVKKGDIITYNIDKYYSGLFYLLIENDNECKNKTLRYPITIDSSHKQNYDYLFTRGEKGTAFDFDYLVAWEGDLIKEPLEIESINVSQSINDLKICSNSVQNGLSRIGTIELRITNKRSEVIKGIEIELNTLITNDKGKLEVTTSEWTDPNGIFNQFYSLFPEYNTTLIDNVKILNLTPDNDLVDEENVYLFIEQINENDTISIFLPYRSTVEKTVYLQYLLFEEPCFISPLENCNSESTEKEIQIDICDSMLTKMEISGNTDLLFLDDTYECPNECYTTKTSDGEGGITYKITNIDTNDFAETFSRTEIINSNELKPYGYIINNNYYALLDNNGNQIDVQENIPFLDSSGNPLYNPSTNEIVYKPNKLEWEQKEVIINKPMIGQNIYCTVTFPNNETVIYAIKTDKNGIANFFIQIPTNLDRTYSIEDLLETSLMFEFRGKKDYNSAVLTNQIINRNNIYDKNKNDVFLEYGNSFKRYKPGEIVKIPIIVSANIKTIQNHFYFNAELSDMGSSDQVTILYKICNITDNQGIFKTTFKTDDKQLVPNEISENIYCGILSNLKINATIDKKIVESSNLNIVHLNVENQQKKNKDVEIQINLGKIPESYMGDYDFIDIDIEQGDYSIIEENETKNIIVSWLIGDMAPFEKEKANIKIRAKNVGLSDIKIKSFDYLHNTNINIEDVGKSKCNKCDEKIMWRIKDSSWLTLKDLLNYDYVVTDMIYEDGEWKYILESLSNIRTLGDLNNAIMNLEYVNNEPVFERFTSDSHEKLEQNSLINIRGLLVGVLLSNGNIRYDNFSYLSKTAILLNIDQNDYLVGDYVTFSGNLTGIESVDNKTIIVNGQELITDSSGYFEGAVEARYIGSFAITATFDGDDHLRRSTISKSIEVNTSLERVLSDYDYVIMDITYDDNGFWKYETKPTSEISVVSDLNNAVKDLTFKNNIITFDKFSSELDISILNINSLSILKGLLLGLEYDNFEIRHESLDLLKNNIIQSVLSEYDYVVMDMTYQNGSWKYDTKPTSEITQPSDLNNAIKNLIVQGDSITFDRFSLSTNQSIDNERLLMNLEGLLIGLEYDNEEYNIKYETLNLSKNS